MLPEMSGRHLFYGRTNVTLASAVCDVVVCIIAPGSSGASAIHMTMVCMTDLLCIHGSSNITFFNMNYFTCVYMWIYFILYWIIYYIILI